MNISDNLYFYLPLIVFIIGDILLCWSFFIEPRMLTLKNYNLENSALKGLKIVFASDIHAAPNDTSRVKKIVNLIQQQNPDLIIFGGDFFKGYSAYEAMSPKDIAQLLRPLHAPLGVFTVYGNHDEKIGTKILDLELQIINMHTLVNESKSLNFNGTTFYLCGVADISTKRCDLNKTLENTTAPQILVTHSPDIFPLLKQKIVLTLAGHTHGGQVRLPFLGAIIVPSAYGRKYADGLIEENGNKLIVTRGLGTSLFPLRFNCKPEITVINFV